MLYSLLSVEIAMARMLSPNADMICCLPSSCRVCRALTLDSKLSLTVVRPNLQSAPEPPAVDK